MQDRGLSVTGQMVIPVRPLTHWPGPRTNARVRSRFDSSWSSTRGLLDHELRQLGAQRPVMHLDVTESEIRRDGQVRANSRPRSPAVRLLFDLPDGTMALGCDKFTDWQDNVRAIALGLQALRLVDRYGISQAGEQYKGYLQLEAPGADALLVLARMADMPLEHARDHPGEAWKKARAAAHPDRHGGDHTQWDTAVAAARSLGIEGV